MDDEGDEDKNLDVRMAEKGAEAKEVSEEEVEDMEDATGKIFCFLGVDPGGLKGIVTEEMGQKDEEEYVIHCG